LHARLYQESNKAALAEFLLIAESLGRLTADMRDIAMSVRMVPVADTFVSFNRLVHDLAKNLGKKIRLETLGGETELDKNVIEELRDPLMHLIRNAADHGIEMPDVRRKAGKDETGMILLNAEYAGAHVRVSVYEDGAGLDREKILSRAIERGMTVASDADDKTIYALIFEPGFSTAEKTTDVSGRGVGMDVVKKNIEKLRGSIDVKTEKGSGTTIALTIPLTLAIIDGFMVEVCGQLYIFNLSLVRECLEYDGSSEITDNQGIVRIRDDLVPFIDMRGLFELTEKKCSRQQIVVTEFDGSTIGFLVDRVVGHCQTVIKPLGKQVADAEMFSGATILGDGSIALVLDVNRIISAARMTDVVAAQHSNPTGMEALI
jgi:two-component system, chemotaxis family, sensor kinase CheA